MSHVGINVGAITVKSVAINNVVIASRVAVHQGHPTEVLRRMLADAEFKDAEYFGVCGNIGHISNVILEHAAGKDAVLLP